ncbi:MAG: acylphosphatase [Candidatus Riflebacteria bacterium]|nr:acylphosphatase [Candidatus Riflebacteria bacterium]
MATIEYVVSGIVQGVGYRYYTLKVANQLGVTGWVRNLPTGEVQVVASGDPGVLGQLEQCLLEGPRMSRVARVTRAPAPEQSFHEFSVRY